MRTARVIDKSSVQGITNLLEAKVNEMVAGAQKRAAGQAAQDRAAQPPAEAAQPPSDAAQPHMTIVQEVVEEEELHGPLDLPMQVPAHDLAYPRLYQ